MKRLVRALFGGVSLGAMFVGVAVADPAASAPADAPQTTAHAQTQAQAAGTDSSTSEDVIVHARRRDETLFSTPVAVTAISGTQLQDRGVARIEELNQLVPNVQIRQSSSTAGAVEVNIRGQQVAISNPNNDPPVGLYYDDVYIAQSKGAAAALFDLQDVEVARGVQGTLSGRNNTGGAIRFYTHKPDLGAFEGSISGSVGTLDLTRFQAILNVPIGQTLAVRIGYSNNQRNEFGNSLITGEPFQGIDQQFWRASVLWQPFSRFSNLFTYEDTVIDQPQMNIRAVPGTNVACAVAAGTATCPPSTSNVNQFLHHYPLTTIIPSSIHDNSWDFLVPGDNIKNHFFRDTAQLDITDNVHAKIILGYRELHALSGLDVDFSPGFVAHSTNFGAISYQSTEEAQLYGTAFHNNFDWVTGYFHFEDISDAPANTLAALGGSPPATLAITILDRVRNKSDAFYAHGEYHVTDAWRIAAGIRSTDDDRYYRPSRLNGANCGLRGAGNALLVASGPCPVVNLEKDFSYISYEFSTTYEVNDHLTAYFRTGRGQKSGGFSGAITRVDTPAFLPEEVTDYEVGIHARHLFNNAVDLNADIYFTDYKNMQRYTSSAVPGIGITNQTINAGSATIQGAEFDGSWRLTDRLTLSGYAGWIDAGYNKFTVLDSSFVSHDLSNMEWYQTPKFNSRINLGYDVPISYGHLSINGGWYHQSSASLYVLTFPQLIQKPYSLFDARATWTSPNDVFDFSVWGTNLTDKDYATGASASPVSPFDTSQGLNSAGLVAGDGRVVGATLTYHFGQ